jgi:MFS transporter, putative metabolite:H+ symporter
LKKNSLISPIFWAVFVAALGYFVDAYDIVLFSVIRVKSLQGIGVPEVDIFNVGVNLLNWQLVGLLVGGVFWGGVGDKKGRLSVLFGSIFIYSVSNILNGFVHSVEVYELLRFTTGLGLAGELGAGITLVTEIMSKTGRGWGTTIIAAVGVMGVVAASLVGQAFSWQTSFFVGGGMGIVLLFLRLGVYESGMYQLVLRKKVPRGNFLSLFTSQEKFLKYFSSILVALPVWYLVGILLTFSPEIGKSMGMSPLPNSGQAVFYAYIGLTIGDMTSGTLSQLLKNRKKVILGFLGLTSFFMILFFICGGLSLPIFYGLCTAMGFSVGYWAIFVVVTSEQFGTNIRATAATTAPNLVRGSAVLLTTAFQWLTPSWGAVGAAEIVGLVTMALAFWALRNLEETYGKNLDYTEPL